jgi:glyoxylase-like metal-dependent hydrolase (beta-lactamase superfamily II)
VDDVLLTHQHYDHVLDAAALAAAGSRLRALENYSTELTLEDLFKQIGMSITVVPYTIDTRFTPGAALELAGVKMRIAHVPGHSTDSVTFYLPEEGLLFAGDALFAGAIGRTDLPKGSTKQLVDGIVKHLLTLPPETKVFPGHGPSTTIGTEAEGNPYLIR